MISENHETLINSEDKSSVSVVETKVAKSHYLLKRSTLLYNSSKLKPKLLEETPKNSFSSILDINPEPSNKNVPNMNKFTTMKLKNQNPSSDGNRYEIISEEGKDENLNYSGGPKSITNVIGNKSHEDHQKELEAKRKAFWAQLKDPESKPDSLQKTKEE